MTFNCEEQLAGFGKILFYLLSETYNWPLVVTDSNAGQIIIAPEENNVDGTIEPDSIAISDDYRLGDDGNIWAIDIRFVYSVRGEAMEQLLEQYAGLPGIAIACLNDGTRKLFGTDKEPLYLEWKNNYGEKIEDRHGVAIKIKGDMSQRPSFYNPI